MEQSYKGILSLDPIDGYHMSDYDFECVLYVRANRKLVIHKSQLIKYDDDNYILTLDTSDLSRIGYGRINLDVIGHIPDDDFRKGYRKEVLKLWIDM